MIIKGQNSGTEMIMRSKSRTPRFTNVEICWKEELLRTTEQPICMLTFEPRTSKYEATVGANPIEIRQSEMALLTVLASDYRFC